MRKKRDRCVWRKEDGQPDRDRERGSIAIEPLSRESSQIISREGWTPPPAAGTSPSSSSRLHVVRVRCPEGRHEGVLDSLLGNPGHDLTVRVAPHVARHPPEELALGLRGVNTWISLGLSSSFSFSMENSVTHVGFTAIPTTSMGEICAGCWAEGRAPVRRPTPQTRRGEPEQDGPGVPPHEEKSQGGTSRGSSRLLFLYLPLEGPQPLPVRDTGGSPSSPLCTRLLKTSKACCLDQDSS